MLILPHLFEILNRFLGYILLCLVRQTIPIALPSLINFEYTGYLELSYFFAYFPFFYGILKFINGIIMDFKNCPLFIFGLGHIITGLAAISIPFLYNNSILLLFILMLLAWGQGTGWPAITKFMTTNFDTYSIASLWGIMTISHQLGSCSGFILLPSIINTYDIKNTFLYSGSFCLLFGIYIILRGYYSREKYNFSTCELHKLLKSCIDIKISGSVLLLCYATFCIYIVKMGVFFWFPIILKDTLQISLLKSSLIAGIYD
ncbi:MAG: MFS transporter [Rickettsiales bacterium]|jgi:OPA family glycerol-3-phosphate transporter-like MFS transporter|nr:MFS transporter [Rickettsiales bacterium]